MNNKGFTVIELLSSFVLIMIIVVFLFEIVLELRNVYINETVKTEIVNKNAIIATALNQTLEDVPYENVDAKIDGRKVMAAGRTVTYPEHTTFENFEKNINNGVYSVNFIIKNPKLDKDIEFNFVYYRSS